MGISREDIQKVAHLARIGTTDEELKQAEHDLEKILHYVDRLQNIESSGVPEASAPLVHSDSFRADEVVACVAEVRDLILQNFPSRQQDLLKVPAVFERPKK